MGLLTAHQHRSQATQFEFGVRIRADPIKTSPITRGGSPLSIVGWLPSYERWMVKIIHTHVSLYMSRVYALAIKAPVDPRVQYAISPSMQLNPCNTSSALNRVPADDGACAEFGGNHW